MKNQKNMFNEPSLHIGVDLTVANGASVTTTLPNIPKGYEFLERISTDVQFAKSRLTVKANSLSLTLLNNVSLEMDAHRFVMINREMPINESFDVTVTNNSAASITYSMMFLFRKTDEGQK